MTRTRYRLLGSALLLSACVVSCNRDESAYRDAEILTNGDPRQGPAAIGRYGCGACHTIPGIRSATGMVGPPLEGIASRAYLAGQLPNSPANMVRWIQHPQHVEKGTVMPEMGVTDPDARNITAFLYTLR